MRLGAMQTSLIAERTSRGRDLSLVLEVGAATIEESVAYAREAFAPYLEGAAVGSAA